MMAVWFFCYCSNVLSYVVVTFFVRLMRFELNSFPLRRLHGGALDFSRLDGWNILSFSCKFAVLWGLLLYPMSVDMSTVGHLVRVVTDILCSTGHTGCNGFFSIFVTLAAVWCFIVYPDRTDNYKRIGQERRIEIYRFLWNSDAVIQKFFSLTDGKHGNVGKRHSK